MRWLMPSSGWLVRNLSASAPARLWRGVPNADAKPTALSIASASRGEFARTLLLINNDHPRLRLPNATLSGQRERLTLHAARDGDPDRWATVAVVDRELAEWTADGGGFDGLPDHGGRSSGAVAGVPVRTHYACAVELPGRRNSPVTTSTTSYFLLLLWLSVYSAAASCRVLLVLLDPSSSAINIINNKKIFNII